MACLALLTVAGCGSLHYGNRTSPGAPNAGTASASGSGPGTEVPASVVVEIGAAGPYAWAVTGSSLSTSDDGGATWSTAATLTGGMPLAAARLGQDTVWAITESAGSLSFRYSADQATSWTPAPLDTHGLCISGMPAQVDPVSAADVFVSLGGGGAVCPPGELFVSTDGGGRFTREPEPVTGDVMFSDASDGILAGGLANSLLYSTGNAGSTWTRIDLPGPAASGIPALGAPFAQGGTDYVPETIQAPGTAELSFQLLKGPPAGPFSAVSAPIPLSGTNLGPGTPAAVGEYLSQVWVAAPDGSQIYESANLGASWTTVRTSGLPAGPSQLALTGPHSAIALVVSGSCTSPGSGCTENAKVYRTTDDGATWSESTPA